MISENCFDKCARECMHASDVHLKDIAFTCSRRSCRVWKDLDRSRVCRIVHTVNMALHTARDSASTAMSDQATRSVRMPSPLKYSLHCCAHGSFTVLELPHQSLCPYSTRTSLSLSGRSHARELLQLRAQMQLLQRGQRKPGCNRCEIAPANQSPLAMLWYMENCLRLLHGPARME